jgi:hypothetical protein
MMFNKAIQWGFVKMENPVRTVTYYPERQKERILSDVEARDLIDASGILFELRGPKTIGRGGSR